MVVRLTTVTWGAAAPPISTIAPSEKPTPLIVNRVPPRVVTAEGVTLVTRSAVEEGPTIDPPQADT
jgi:hypothetical protein